METSLGTNEKPVLSTASDDMDVGRHVLCNELPKFLAAFDAVVNRANSRHPNLHIGECGTQTLR